MTAAQKTAKAKFKQAIAYRQKTGVSLKEAFAHVYGKKVGAAPKKKAAKKAAPKKADKKVVKKAAPKKVAKKAAKKKHTKYGKVKAHTRRVAGVKKPESVHKDTKSHNVNIRVMSGLKDIKKDALEDYQKVLNRINIAKFKVLFNDEQAKLSNKKSNTYKAFIKNRELSKKYLKELETHARELKKTF